MERTAALCAGCGHVLTAAFVDGELQPVGQPTCPDCGGAEFREYEPTGDTRPDRV